MCMSSPKIDKPPAPEIKPPEEKKLELNPETNLSGKKAKRVGTKKLQIPMTGTAGSGSGLKV